jgi:hypothetical protein
MPRIAITNLSKGEFGPELYGRVDVPQYDAGVKEGRNFLIQRYGGAMFRPGFRFAAEVDNVNHEHRLLPFQYSIDQAYVLLLSDKAQRQLADGGFVVEDDLKILSATQAAQITLEVPFHDLAVGERVWIDGISGMVELNNRFATVAAVPDADHVTLDINSTNFSALIDSTGEVRVGAPAPPVAPEAPPAAPPSRPSPPRTARPTRDLAAPQPGGGPGSWYPSNPEISIP